MVPRPMPVPGTTSFAGSHETVVAEFSFSTSAGNLGGFFFNPSLAWTDQRLFKKGTTTTTAVPTSFYTTPAGAGATLLSSYGTPGYTGQFASLGTVDDWGGKVQWVGSTVHIYYRGTELNKGGSISVLNGAMGFSVLDADYDAGTVGSTTPGELISNPGLTTTHSLGTEKRIHFVPHGPHLSELTQIPESMNVGTNDDTYKFLPQSGTSKADNGWTCGVVINSAEASQLFTVRATHHYRTRLYAASSGLVVSARNPAQLFSADPVRMAAISQQVAGINRQTATTGDSPLVTNGKQPTGPAGDIVKATIPGLIIKYGEQAITTAGGWLIDAAAAIF